jgi:hypothetical protein
VTTPSSDYKPLFRLGFRLESLLALLWLGELVYLAFPSLILGNALTAGLVLFILCALAASRWQTLALCGALLVAAVALSVAFDAWSALWPGFRKSLIFLAFLPSAMLIRATADQRPEIAATRALFGALPRAERDGGLLVGCHAIGSVLSVGIFSLLAPIAGPDSDESERRQLVGVGLRGMCLAAMWSPFFVSMGLASEYLPGVALWRIMPAGLALALVGLLVSYALFDHAGGVAGLARSLRSLAPILPSVATAAVTVAVVSGVTGLSTLQSLAVSVPPLCVLALAPLGRDKALVACRSTYHGLANVGGEIGILTFSVVLGAVFKLALAKSGMTPELALLAPSAMTLIAAIVGTMCVAGFFGIHPIVSATVLLVLVANLPHDVGDLALMMAVLTGWGLAAMISISGISVVLSSALFQIPPERLILRQNLILAGVFGVVAIVLITLVNSVARG